MRDFIGWTTGVLQGDMGWEKWLLNNEKLQHFSNVLQFNFIEDFILLKNNIPQKLQPRISFIHLPKGGRLLDINTFASQIEECLNSYSANENIIVLHPPKVSSDRYSVNKCITRIIHLFKSIQHPRISFGIELTSDVNDDIKFINIFKKEIYDLLNKGEQEIPKIGIILDTEHQAHKSSNMVNVIKKSSNHLLGIHIKDYDGEPFNNLGKRRFIRYGSGNVNFTEVFEHLKDPRIPLILEGHYDHAKELIEDLILLKKHKE